MFVFSLQSQVNAGFIFGKPCEILNSDGDVFTIRVERGHVIDNNYQVYAEQLRDKLPSALQEYLNELEAPNVIDFLTKKPIRQAYHRVYAKFHKMRAEGEKVWVHSRQFWGGLQSNKIPAVVYQKQIGHSVIVSYKGTTLSDRKYENEIIATHEFYDYQLEDRKDWVRGKFLAKW